MWVPGRVGDRGLIWPHISADRGRRKSGSGGRSSPTDPCQPEVCCPPSVWNDLEFQYE